MPESQGAFALPPLHHGAREAAAWWVASELVRRHPDELRISHAEPIDGVAYDCLWVTRNDLSTVVFIHQSTSSVLTTAAWLDGRFEGDRVRLHDVLTSPDPRRDVIEPIEESEALGAPSSTPATTRRSIGPRVIAAYLASGFLGHRNTEDEIHEHRRTSSHHMENGPDHLADDRAIRLLEERRGEGARRNPELDFWSLVVRGRTVATVDTLEGTAWTRGHELDLLRLYEANGRSIRRTAHKAFMDPGL